MVRDTNRTIPLVAAALILTTLALGASASAAPADVDGGPNEPGVDLLDAAFDALSNGDAAAYENVLSQAFNGSVWLPSTAIAALDEEDAEDILAWCNALDLDNADVLDVAYEVVEAERDALNAIAPNTNSTPEQSDDISDADADGVGFLELIDHRQIEITPAARLVLSSLFTNNGNAPDDTDYELGLQELETLWEAAANVSDVNGAPSDEPIDATATAVAEAVPAPAVSPLDDLDRSSELQPAQAPTPTSTSDGAPINEPANGTSLALIVAIALGAAALAVALYSALRGRKNGQLADIAFIDGLTGLNNRRRLDADVAAQRERGYRTTSTLMVDVDHFKKFNDAHGHAMGDEVLRLVGEALSREFRKSDVPYRYGGEEFCVLLEDTTQEEAQSAGERARCSIEAIVLPIPERITASVGVSTGPAVELPSTMKRADGALYDAKEAGRNRVASA